MELVIREGIKIRNCHYGVGIITKLEDMLFWVDFGEGSIMFTLRYASIFFQPVESEN